MLMLGGLAACGGNQPASGGSTLEPDEAGTLTLPDVIARLQEGERLRVLATTSVIGDVVGQGGGGRLDPTVPRASGQGPHRYTPGDRAF